MRLRGKCKEWQTGAQEYLARLGAAEYAAQREAHAKKRRSPKTLRFSPSQYMCDLVELLGNNDEEGFKALKMLQGYASSVGV